MGERLTSQVVAFVHELREADLFKRPGISESIDWAKSLHTLDQLELDQENVESTLGVLLKYQDDVARIQGTEVAEILNRIRTDLDGI